MKTTKCTYFYFAMLLLLAYFTFLMLHITLRYIPFSSTASFLQIKQTEVESYGYYLPVFYTHVYTALFVLLAGFTQFSKIIVTNYKRIHRSMGYVYVLLVLLFAAPTGLVIGFHANGGIVAQFFFITLSVLWWWFTFKAFQYAKQKNFKAHKAFMVRSFALTLSAITLRLWKVILVKLFHPNPMDLYIIISGLGWLPNLLIAEMIILHQQKKLALIFKTLQINLHKK